MQYPFNLPHTIQNHLGEKLVFERTVMEDGVKKVIVRNEIMPGGGPPFHVHFKQDESLTVEKGIMGYQLEGGPEVLIREGESVLFPRGTMHRFWNAGDQPLACTGWVKPAHSLDYFLTGIYRSMDKAGKPEGDPFDSAFLIHRYRTEYDLKAIPPFVKNVIFPVTVLIGRLLGKYAHFKNAPEPIK